ncbi:hypothetical protein C8R48DRAFT_737966 [Suillus tomentosus]|nr:hypothetical protein C8R48DRAFT_737966 [Suillus tomentosus]
MRAIPIPRPSPLAPSNKSYFVPSRKKPAHGTNSPHKPPHPREGTSTPYIRPPSIHPQDFTISSPR